MAELVDCMLDLMRRLPPTRTEENVNALIAICPDYADDLLGSVDQPLQLKTDRATGRDYLACDYNRDGESYRSPWSNEYDPPLEDGTVPTPRLRKLEITANEAFDTYREMYYEGGVSSVYLWDLEDGGFAGVVLFKKGTSLIELRAHISTQLQIPIPARFCYWCPRAAMTPSSDQEPSGSWDSIHVFESGERGRQAHYKLTSTIMLQLTTHQASEEGNENEKKAAAATGHTKTKDIQFKRNGEVTIGGSMTRQHEQDWPIHDPSSHITNTGKMIEEMEIKMRNSLQEVYFGKTRDIVYDLRSVDDLERARRQRELQKELVGFIKR
ncbi:F-actin capping protein, beta subunit [Macrolepiota fuliginosa MF-IS2]|uniref:F-actin-capping protein subunit beta n=1 Tax=Macrolepiota fuliginosa MF-IS2 TaxID=1400762 RepID=A0A9P5XHX5_9AGAR|nr:F-actin capping protein, beta subunit [Macrolepiota fuliginosa MF-IS2]